MKKTFLTLAIAMLTTSVFSQITFKPGVRAGVNLASVVRKGDTKTDFYAGGLLEMKMAWFYSLQPEITYSRQGAKSTVPGVDDLEVQYLGISFVNKFSNVKDLGLHAIIGVTLDFKVGENVDYSDVAFSDLAPLDYAWFGGVGFDFSNGLGINARYKLGLIDIDDGNTTIGFGGSPDDNNLNGVFQLGLSYKFEFNKK